MSVGKKTKPEVPILPPLPQPIKSDAALGSGIKILSATSDAASDVKHTERLCCIAFGFLKHLQGEHQNTAFVPVHVLSSK